MKKIVRMVEARAGYQAGPERNLGQSQKESLGSVQFERTPQKNESKDPRHLAAAKLEDKIQASIVHAPRSAELQAKIKQAREMMYYDDPTSFEINRTLADLDLAHQEAQKLPERTPSKAAALLDKIFGWIEG